MVVTNADRRHSLTRTANYASIALERAPADVHWTGSPASNKQARQELQKQTDILQNTHRKSLVHMDAQRKLLEKSMLAYTEKMKKISNERPGHVLKKRVHKVRRASDTQSLPGESADLSERIEIPVNSGDLRKRRRKRNLRKRESMFSPIVESSSTPDSSHALDFKSLRMALRRSSSADRIHPADLLYLNTSRTEGDEPITKLGYCSDTDIPDLDNLNNNILPSNSPNCTITVLSADAGNEDDSHKLKTESSVHLPDIHITNSPLLSLPSAPTSRRGSASSTSSYGSSMYDSATERQCGSCTDEDNCDSPRSSVGCSSLVSTPRSSTEHLSGKQPKVDSANVTNRLNGNSRKTSAEDVSDVMLTVPKLHVRSRSNSKSKKDADTLLRSTVLKNAYRKSAELGTECSADGSDNWVGRARSFTH